jgi:peptidyl-prolyl cis-trans isomerase-like 2
MSAVVRFFFEVPIGKLRYSIYLFVSMGKGQHSKDKMYLLRSEWKYEGGGNRGQDRSSIPAKTLPFDCCSLSLSPFFDPVATDEGTIFDIV